jgi:hypothetical protein
MTIYSDPIFTRAEIDAARPAISTVGGYPFAHCLASRVSSWTGNVFIADYSELFAWKCENRFNSIARKLAR